VILADTHAWLWWLNEDERLSTEARRHFLSSPPVMVADISCWEVALLVSGRRLSLSRDLKDWFADALLPGVSELVPHSPAIAIRAAGLRSSLRDPADCLIAATAIDLNIPLATADSRLRELPVLRTVW
jgi:PIN domain nuclease of toxin-antitoxin system